MDLFEFLRYTLAWTVTVAMAWPVNVPLAGLAFKIRNGPKPIDMEKYEYWVRSTFAALGLAILSLIMVVLDYYLAFEAEFPAGPVHAMVFMAFLPVAAWIFFVLFAQEDLLQGMSIVTLYLYLPIFVLLVLHGLFGLWSWPLDQALEYLKKTS